MKKKSRMQKKAMRGERRSVELLIQALQAGEMKAEREAPVKPFSGQVPRVIGACQVEKVIMVDTFSCPRDMEQEPQAFIEYWTLGGRMIGRFKKEG